MQGLLALESARENVLPSFTNSDLNIQENDSRKRKIQAIDFEYVPLNKLIDPEDEFYSSCDEDSDEEEGYYEYSDKNSDIDEIKTNHKNDKEKRGYCFACDWVGNGNDAKTLSINKANTIVFMINSNYGIISDLSLAKAVHGFYKNEIWLPKKELPLWRTKDILLHIQKHSLNPVIYVGRKIRRMENLYDVVENMLFRKLNEGGSIIPDQKMIKALTEIEKNIRELYKTPIKSMNFTSENGIDPEKIGLHINLNKNWEISSFESNKTK